MEYILRNVLITLLDLHGSTLLDVPRLFDDPDFRSYAVGRVQNPEVRRFWLREYQKYPPHFRAEAIAPIQNKIGEFLVNPLLRRLIGQPRSTFDRRQVMDQGKILLVNLAKGKIGEDTAALLGAMLVTKMGLAALSRADVPEADRRDFYLYVDEFPLFTTTSFATMLSEMRKYRLGLVLAHQFLQQVEETVRHATIAFTGLGDALLLEKEFCPELNCGDLISLPNYHVYLKVMIDGMVSTPFSAITLSAPSC